MRYCQGDYECPHCGADLDENLHAWAEAMVDAIVSADGAGEL